MSELPSSIQDQTKAQFATILMQKAMRLINLKKVSISFSKGNMDSYLILSGLVKDDRNHECKIVYKKREEGTEQGPLTSNCDCSNWNKDKHCEHTAALFVFHLLNQQMQNDPNQAPIYPSGPLGFASDHAVTVDMFGTIVWGPQYLNGGSSAHSYSSMQYLLLNRKVVNFPLPKKIDFKIRLDLLSKDPQTKEPYRIPQLFFSYENAEGNRVKEVSLFENHYLFDWKSGEAFHLDKETKDFISKVKFSSTMHDTDEVVNYFLNTDLGNEMELFLDGKAWEDIEEVEIYSRLAISPSEKKGYLAAVLSFFDNNEVIRKPPKLIKALNFSSGILASFRRKKDGYAFIKDLADDLKDGTDVSKQHLNQMLAKDKIVQYVKNVRESKNQYIYDVEREQKYKIDLNYIQKYIINFITCFSETSFRFSEYFEDRMEIEYLVPTNTLLSGVSVFYQSLEPYGLSIYYNQVEVHKWRSRIKFERRSHTTKWFDLELQISDEDLEIIRNAEIQNGVVLSSKGMILLNQEQKDLIRFMKKYTQYEGETKEGEEEQPKTEEEKGLKKFVLPFQRARIFELFELKKMGIDGALTDEEFQICENLANLKELPNYEVPEKLKDIMRPYQLTGYQWLNFLYEYQLGACLADDMGLGKTLQAISFIEKNIDKMEKVLVVCPVSILLNWEKEFQKFSNIDLSIYHGGSREFDDSKKVILTSYGVMKKEHSTTFANYHFDCLILDEVQHLKNIRSLGAYAARSIKADFRICLTGTPVENDLSEFYNILDLAVPGIWGNLEFVRTVSNKKSRLLARKTARPFILRRTKDQVLNELPPKTENNVYLSFEDTEDNSYKDLLKTVKNRIYLSPSKKRYGEILKGILELRKSCLWQETNDIDPVLRQNINSTKIHFLIETLQQIKEEGHKAIVFSQFTTYLDLIQKALHEQHYNLARIDGSQSIKKRQEQVDLFQEGNAEVFLISLKAGGVGLNLTAASYVFIMDPWWNPAVEAQAIDRAHRIGQKNTLTVYRPIIKGSVEEKVLELQAMKRELFNDLMADDDENVYSGKLTMQDFETLLE